MSFFIKSSSCGTTIEFYRINKVVVNEREFSILIFIEGSSAPEEKKYDDVEAFRKAYAIVLSQLSDNKMIAWEMIDQLITNST